MKTINFTHHFYLAKIKITKTITLLVFNIKFVFANNLNCRAIYFKFKAIKITYTKHAIMLATNLDIDTNLKLIMKK